MSDLDLSDFQTEDDLAGYDHPKPGTYHCAIEKVDASHEKYKTGIIVDFYILAGTVDKQVGKKFDHAFSDPSETHADGGKFSRKMLAKLGLSTGLIVPVQLGSKIPTPNWDDLVGRQLVVALRERKYKKKDGSEGTGVEIDGVNMFLVRDPKVEAVPKDKEALAMLGDEPVEQPAKTAPPVANGAAHVPTDSADAYASL